MLNEIQPNVEFMLSDDRRLEDWKVTFGFLVAFYFFLDNSGNP